ncbi:MAG TPA: ABC transporter ATP-binding protein [Bryobacteraceae bacterium]|jgi:ATP-binding cassette subfamily B protein|nr:ABC transporter ATP-binding protein [Bryobacteraceae bacterium]
MTWRDRLAALRNVPPVLRLVWRAAPKVVAAGLVLRVFSALTPLAALGISKWIIDLVVAAVRHPGPLPQQIWFLLGAEFLVAAVGNVLGRAIDYTDARLADEFTREVSLRVMEHAARLDLETFEDPLFQDKLERARLQATDRIGMLNSMGRLLLQSITLISLSIGVIVYSPWLFAVLVICVAPAFAGESHFAFRGYTLAHSLTPIRRELDYLRVVGSGKESAKEVKVFGLGGFLRSRYGALTDAVIRRNRELTRQRLWWGSALAIVGSVGYYASFAYLVWRTLLGEISVGTLTFLAGAIAGSSAQLQGVFSLFSSISDQALFLTDLVDFLAIQPRIQSKANAIVAPRPIRQGFEFRDVSFHYPGSERLVLDRLNFRIERGEHIALVGENGQGKTTLVKLMARLYDPTSGVISLDGVDLREYDVEDLQREIGIIFQDFVRYDMPARMNIGVGRIEETDQDESLWIAAKKSRADRTLERLAGGLDQMLGRRFEGGVDLSGGEWQKFALARAYLRNAQVLILDEPTAALDAVAESEVFARFAELAHNSTAILISHRFSTVRKAGRIVVLEGGRIREQGTHDQLVMIRGRYARLFELQAANYR